jgi:hypothetical protein
MLEVVVILCVLLLLLGAVPGLEVEDLGSPGLKHYRRCRGFGDIPACGRARGAVV